METEKLHKQKNYTERKRKRSEKYQFVGGVFRDPLHIKISVFFLHQVIFQIDKIKFRLGKIN